MSAGDSRYDDSVEPTALSRLRGILLRFPEVRTALRTPRTVMHSRAVPYLAGISTDGRMIYVDSHLPERIDGIPLAPYLRVHEEVEWALHTCAAGDPKLREYRTYEAAHHLATAAEQYAVVSDGHDWDEYREGLHPYFVPIEREMLKEIPPDLAEYPYSGAELKKVQAAKAKARFTQGEVNYTVKSLRATHCGICSMFLPRTRACTIVEPSPKPIVPEGGCDKFEPRGRK
jgi:hypothetical protein